MDKRLDILIFEKNLAKSREAAKELIKNNQISVHGRIISKPSALISESDDITVVGNVLKYVSRGGLKLEKAINEFDISLNNKICMDIGASTGGFTDCMLQNGAKKVYAVDVGTGQLHNSLRNDDRVINQENTNFRYIDTSIFTDDIDIITVDVSFISLKHILPKIVEISHNSTDIVALVKPQFEAGKENIGKKGIVKDKQVHLEVLNNLNNYIKINNLNLINIAYSPIKGASGNIEYLTHLKITGSSNEINFKDLVNQAFEIL